MSDFFAVVASQRAHRSFTDEPVDDVMVERVLGAAICAPSAENSQPWVFVVVRDADRRARIGALAERAWTSGGRQHAQARLQPRLLADVDAGATGGVARAPVLVVVGGDTARCVPAALEASVWPAVQNLLLAAEALGLGSALTTLPTVFAEELAALVGFPDTVRPMAVVPLGWPARHLGLPARERLATRAHREVYGAAW